MKTTIEIPDHIFRSAKAVAAQKGQSLRVFFTRAIEEQLRREINQELPHQEPWRNLFGALRDLHRENVHIRNVMEEEFGKVEENDWR